MSKKNLIVAIDLGGTKIKSGLFNIELNQFIAKKEIETDAFSDRKKIINKIVNLIFDLLKETNNKKNNLKGIGLGSPGIIKNNIVIGNAENFKNWNGTNIEKELKKYFDIEIIADNDVNVAVTGELFFGNAKNKKNVFMFTLGTGIGGGIIINKKLYTGAIGAAGEVGHLIIIPEGKECSCGKKGCWEAYCSATGLKNIILDFIKDKKNTVFHKFTNNDLNKLEAKHLFDAIKQNDELANQILDIYVYYLSIGLGSCINILNPELVLIGGGISKSYHLFEKLLLNKIKKFALPIPLKKCKIKKAKLLNDAGIYGAVSLFLQ
ncbi:MAG TPA: ROK family protein [bacterium]|nr:ROK family protein [bacterium]HOL46668.1 ROK family protein [bacterium]HPQ18356.1 ROK family protein [bacterium]